MFPYHNRLKQQLKTEPYEVIEEDGKPFAYRFLFPMTGKTVPIRPYRVLEYKYWLDQKGVDYGKYSEGQEVAATEERLYLQAGT